MRVGGSDGKGVGSMTGCGVGEGVIRIGESVGGVTGDSVGSIIGDGVG